jgi:hypothetical protein
VMALVVICVKEERLATAVKLRRIDRGSKGWRDRSPVTLMRLRRPTSRHWLSYTLWQRMGKIDCFCSNGDSKHIYGYIEIATYISS